VLHLIRLIPLSKEPIMPLPIEQWLKDLIGAVANLMAVGPANLLKRINVDRDDDQVTAADLVKFFNDDNQQSNEGVRRLALALSHWDFEQAPPWDTGADATSARSVERRAKVYELLRLPPEAAQRLNDIAPVATMRTTVISTKLTTPWWYTEERRTPREFYWPHYKDYLLKKRPGFTAEAVEALDRATDDVVQRLSDPTSDNLYQSKGLVVGYVQSGKTANFTGLIAKAIDAGYRLIIVMTGTIEMLRSQTQRRLDMDLVGRENLVRGIVDTSKEFDYVDDVAWLGDKFIRHGDDDFLARGYPAIERLTFLNDDYQRLKQGLTRMQLQFRDRAKPFYDPENLYPADVRLVIVKKNKSVLEKLAQDLEPLHDKLSEIPALIIDDEADLASVNTKNPKRTADRTAINKAIRKLLGYLERGQLVMYTATPFANFFVDPDDAEDIFPKNFIITLDRPPTYMGVEDFHDIDWNTEDDKSDPAKSNERAYVRAVGPPPVVDDSDDWNRRVEEMQIALDSFLLAGAVKVFREENDGRRFRHHTMLVHEDIRNAAQREQAELVREAWKRNRYDTVKGTARLKKLWNEDMHPVCKARAGEDSIPEDFDLLKKQIGEAYRRVTEVGDPVLIINSDTEVQQNQQALDFDRNEVWRILVGGAKLSRGFTVEGLTTSFYTRKALQGDTLMQAGRWFGFRDGYRDLVRLFIRRDPKDQPRRVDLYEAFEGLMRDERALRQRLQEYEGFQDDGTPILEPWQVPPIVSQHLPYLRPTARQKMFNADVHTMGDSGRLRDFYGFPERSSVAEKTANFELFVPLLKTVTPGKEFVSSRSKLEDKSGSFKALTGVIAADQFVKMLGKLKWHRDYLKVAEPMVRFWESLSTKGALDDVVIVWPQLTKAVVVTRDLPGLGAQQVVTRRRRVYPRVGFVGSDSKHRDALQRIAGAKTAAADPVADGFRDPSGKRGSILVYVAADRTDAGDGESPASSLEEKPTAHDVVVLMSMVAPATATPQGRPVVEWTVVRRSESGTVVVDPT
jgi:hypothetical protein